MVEIEVVEARSLRRCRLSVDVAHTFWLVMRFPHVLVDGRSRI